MENSKQLATESFSYSWLIDKNPPSYDDSLNKKENTFDFNVPVITSDDDDSLVHADEIFSHGQIKPVYTIERSKLEEGFIKTSISVPPSPISQLVEKKRCHYSLGKWRKSSKRILEKCFGFVTKPLCRIGNSRVDDLDRKVFELEKWSNIYSLEVSPKPSFDFYNGIEKVKSWRSSPNISPSRINNDCYYDAENSITEAILYCKKSIGN
ncbi:hypothetical protein ACP275_14G146200 [Erythranthe tilingii]